MVPFMNSERFLTQIAGDLLISLNNEQTSPERITTRYNRRYNNRYSTGKVHFKRIPKPSKKRIEKIGSIIIEIYTNDHPPPHFHVKSEKFTAKYTIQTLELLGFRGKLRPKEDKIIKEWAEENQVQLMNIWNESRPIIAKAAL
ncbi:DUF4160 domain-containing protein [Cytobacillus firmus]|uniref:DUF4160 domain-containing protein n=1 Tax=Cytobacillus firmus TaxID=1399 RepID=UPI001CFD0DF5|nr:DUF4160 domain-containing protein [Cytobacillus firmus]